MALHRITRKDNPSDQFVDDFDRATIIQGMWVFTREGGPNPVSSGELIGNWSAADFTVEIEEHGGTWRTLDPDSS
jgi:hypothetical protein